MINQTNSFAHVPCFKVNSKPSSFAVKDFETRRDNAVACGNLIAFLLHSVSSSFVFKCLKTRLNRRYVIWTNSRIQNASTALSLESTGLGEPSKANLIRFETVSHVAQTKKARSNHEYKHLQRLISLDRATGIVIRQSINRYKLNAL